MLRAARLLRPLLVNPPVSTSLLCQAANPLRAPFVGHARCLMIEPGQTRTASPGAEAALRKKDNLPPEYNIIYRAPLQRYIAVTYCATWVSIVSVPLILAGIYFYEGDHTVPVEIGGIPLFETATEAYILTAILVVTIINIAHTVSRYPYRIYRNAKENKYVAIFQHPFPGLRVQRVFAAGDVKKSHTFLWRDSCYAIKKKKMLVVPDNFSTPAELELMQIDPKLKNPMEIRKRRSKML